MSTLPLIHWQGKRGFTLVELLVSITILSLMLAGLATAISFVSSAWVNGVGMMDNFTKARVALSLVDRDVQLMVMRRDVAAFVDSSGKTSCEFYTNVQGNPGGTLTAPDTRTLSLVQYALATPTTTPTLQRLNYGMNFLTTSGAAPIFGNVTSLTAPPNTNLQTDTVFTGVVLFEIQFVDGSGVIQSAYSYSTTQFYPVPTTNSRSVIVSMLVLNNSAYELAIKTGTIAALQGMFSTLPANQTYSQYWNGVLASPPAGFSSLPSPVRKGIQVFERHIPLPMTTPSA